MCFRWSFQFVGKNTPVFWLRKRLIVSVDFCTFCCREQITDVFGEDSKEFSNYEDLLIDLSIEEGNIDLEVNDEDGHEAIAE